MAISATNITSARKNLKSLTDDVVDHNDHIIIRKPKNRNVVVMSEAEFNSWQETLYLLSTQANRDNLIESLAQADRGDVHTLTPEEWDRLKDENE